MESPFEKLGRHVDPAHFDATSHENPVLPKWTQNWVFYQGSPLGISRKTGVLKFPRQLPGAPRGFSFPLAGRRTKFARPRRTKSRRSNWHIFDPPLFHDIWNSHPWPWCCVAPRGAAMIPSLTGVLGSATAQENPVLTRRQVSYDLTCACCLSNTPRGKNRTWSDAIGDGRDSDRIVKLDSDKKLLCVKCGLRTKSCTQNRTPLISSSLMATRSKLTINFSPGVAAPRITSAVNWEHLKHYSLMSKRSNSWRYKTTV